MARAPTSALAGLLFRLVLAGVGAPAPSDHDKALAVGYACRLGQNSPPRPQLYVDRVQSCLATAADGSLDIARTLASRDHLMALTDYVFALASNEAALLAIFGENHGTWLAFSACAADWLYGERPVSGPPDEQLTQVRLITHLMQLGYGIGFIDEIAKTTAR
jgi:hypothetical protein